MAQTGYEEGPREYVVHVRGGGHKYRSNGTEAEQDRGQGEKPAHPEIVAQRASDRDRRREPQECHARSSADERGRVRCIERIEERFLQVRNDRSADVER